jgi:hypothetical protein
MIGESPSTELQRRWEDLLARAQPPEWVRQMIEHYQRTGSFRPEDLRRLLGDPTKGVEVGPNTSLSSLSTELTRRSL